MKISQVCIEMIKKFEGCSLATYKCSAGVFTIGYGHTGVDVTNGMSITSDQAEKLLVADLETFEHAVSSLVKVPLNQNQFDALVSWTYNLGPINLARSTMLKELNAGHYDAVPAQMKKWIYSDKKVLLGLATRRDEEAKLFSALMPSNSCSSAGCSHQMR